MIDALKAELASLGPLKIDAASFADPSLTLSGEAWSFNSPSAWRVINAGVLEFGWSSVDAPDLIWELCGLLIVSIAHQSPLMRGDPAFQLSDGRWLEIFSDHAVDPWSMRLPTKTYVGSPSDPSQTGATRPRFRFDS